MRLSYWFSPHLFFLLSAALATGAVKAGEEIPVAFKGAVQACRNEASALLRLDCYDSLFAPAQRDPKPSLAIVRSDIVVKALELEERRQPDSTEPLVQEQRGALSAQVIISIPAVGVQPPRPLLIFSCQDNITRMQIALFKPVQNSANVMTFKTNTGQAFQSHWFIRDGGFLLESSRGLPAIAEMHKMLAADSLSIHSDDPYLNGLSFQLAELDKIIVPLRQACRW